MIKVTVWLRGYASDDRMVISLPDDATDAQISREVTCQGGPSAKLAWVTRPQPVQVPDARIDEAYCRMMSRNDNS